jgi:hypothetical protein
MNQRTNSSKAYLLPILGTAALFSSVNYDLDEPISYLPNSIANYTALANEDQYEVTEIYTSETLNLSQILETKDNINTIIDFSKKILDNAVSLDDEILEKLNENFWDLI